MEITSVTQARFVSVVDVLEFDPKGRVHYPELFSKLAKRFDFRKFPQKPEEADLAKGALFESGKWDHGSVDKLTIFRDGFVVDTRASTDESEAFLNECLTWAASEFGILFNPDMLKRKAYVNQFVFHSDAPLLTEISSPLTLLSKRVAAAVQSRAGQNLNFQPTQVWIHYDLLLRKTPIAAFTIQRRLDVPYSENKYFSEAPLRTQEHEELLEAYEADVVRELASKK